MTRALVTQLLNALQDSWNPSIDSLGRETKAKSAIKAAREYLATEPSGERAELIAGLRGSAARLYEEDCGAIADEMMEAADMLEADAQQAKRVPMTDNEIARIAQLTQSAEPGNDGYILPFTFARAIEAHHGITQGEKP